MPPQNPNQKYIHLGIFLDRDGGTKDLFYTFRKRSNNNRKRPNGKHYIHFRGLNNTPIENYNAGRLKIDMVTCNPHLSQRWAEFMHNDGSWLSGKKTRGEKARHRILRELYDDPAFVDPFVQNGRGVEVLGPRVNTTHVPGHHIVSEDEDEDGDEDEDEDEDEEEEADVPEPDDGGGGVGDDDDWQRDLMFVEQGRGRPRNIPQPLPGEFGDDDDDLQMDLDPGPEEIRQPRVDAEEVPNVRQRLRTPVVPGAMLSDDSDDDENILRFPGPRSRKIRQQSVEANQASEVRRRLELREQFEAIVADDSDDEDKDDMEMLDGPTKPNIDDNKAMSISDDHAEVASQPQDVQMLDPDSDADADDEADNNSPKPSKSTKKSNASHLVTNFFTSTGIFFPVNPRKVESEAGKSRRVGLVKSKITIDLTGDSDDEDQEIDPDVALPSIERDVNVNVSATRVSTPYLGGERSSPSYRIRRRSRIPEYRIKSRSRSPSLVFSPAATSNYNFPRSSSNVKSHSSPSHTTPPSPSPSSSTTTKPSSSHTGQKEDDDISNNKQPRWTARSNIFMRGQRDAYFNRLSKKRKAKRTAASRVLKSEAEEESEPIITAVPEGAEVIVIDDD